MGVPSYYKKLISSIPGLVSKSTPSYTIEWLWMDFNCLIYHCLHRDDISPYPGEELKVEWEKELIEQIVKYTSKVIQKVNPTLGVHICIDGVVPMAKMRQQRLRRFKSSWMTAHGLSKDGGNESTELQNKEKWDTNAITPGTDFMMRLKLRLERMSNKKIHISGADEPGEGEHKIMTDWRTGQFKGNFAVYGLDADLIILSILNRDILGLENEVFLFREEINGGKIERDSLGEEEFEWFSIHLLREHIVSRVQINSDYSDNSELTKKKKQSEYILQYCFAMSILGNDFLPSSLGLKIRDDGHSELLEILDKLSEKRLHLVRENLEIDFHGLQTLFTLLSVEEHDRISHYVDRKLMQACGLGLIGNEPVEIQIGDNNWPLGHIEELCLRLERKKLIPNWEKKYSEWLLGSHEKSIEKVCEDYLYTIQWAWNYYIGNMKNICFNWYYPYKLPPLWKWLSNYLHKENKIINFPGNVLVRASDISPLEQLCIVLPLSSWNLIPKCKQKNLPSLAPQYFPEDFTFDSLGKRFFWECEAEIPLISIKEIKAFFP